MTFTNHCVWNHNHNYSVQPSAKILTWTLCQLLPPKYFAWRHLLKEQEFRNLSSKPKYTWSHRTIALDTDTLYLTVLPTFEFDQEPTSYSAFSINGHTIKLSLSAQRYANCFLLPTKTSVTNMLHTRFSVKSEIQSDTFGKNSQCCCILHRSYTTSNSVFKNQRKTCFAYA